MKIILRSVHPSCMYFLMLLARQIDGWEQDIAAALLGLVMLHKAAFSSCVVRCTLYMVWKIFHFLFCVIWLQVRDGSLISRSILRTEEQPTEADKQGHSAVYIRQLSSTENEASQRCSKWHIETDGQFLKSRAGTALVSVGLKTSGLVGLYQQ